MGAIAAHETGDTAATAAWDETVWRILKKEDIRLVTYVPDKVLSR